MTTPKEKAASPCQGEAAQVTTIKPKSIKKIDRVIRLLETMPEGLNCFEAPQYGDSCLHSTVAEIRKRYGDKLIQRWERVPSRFNPDGVRVCRYWIVV
jgi:hypothetical protein